VICLLNSFAKSVSSFDNSWDEFPLLKPHWAPLSFLERKLGAKMIPPFSFFHRNRSRSLDFLFLTQKSFSPFPSHISFFWGCCLFSPFPALSFSLFLPSLFLSFLHLRPSPFPPPSQISFSYVSGIPSIPIFQIAFPSRFSLLPSPNSFLIVFIFRKDSTLCPPNFSTVVILHITCTSFPFILIDPSSSRSRFLDPPPTIGYRSLSSP